MPGDETTLMGPAVGDERTGIQQRGCSDTGIQGSRK
jgi:hypothetical protein